MMGDSQRGILFGNAVSSAGACLIAVMAVVAMALSFAVPAWAQEPEREGGLQGAQPQVVSTQSTGRYSSAASDSTVSIKEDGQRVHQGTGVVWTYDLSDLKSDSSWKSDWKMEIKSALGQGAVRYEAVDAEEGLFSITAEQAGEVTLTCMESWVEEADWPDDGVSKRQYEEHSFVIDVVSLENLSGELAGAVAGNESSKLFTVKLDGLVSDIDVSLESDSNKKGWSSVKSVDDGGVSLYVYGTGTHNITLAACGKTISCKVVLRQLKLKKTAAVKNTGSVVTYPGKKSALKVKLTGVKSPKVKWSSTNSKIARVTKKGVVKAKGKGRCYVKAKVDGATVKVLVEVTSKAGAQAVANGFKDMKKNLTYSQPNRMSATCRDCSSFVSRCYWDDSLGRRIAKIGEGAAEWAYTAAGQAQWLNSHGKRVAWKSCSVKRLRPGDTVYFETDYAGKDASQWRYIDHAALYVGNGYLLNTGGYGGKGTIGLRQYWAKDSSVKFIGRPCA